MIWLLSLALADTGLPAEVDVCPPCAECPTCEVCEVCPEPPPVLDGTTLGLMGLAALGGVLGTLAFVRIREREELPPLPPRALPETSGPASRQKPPVVILPPPRKPTIEAAPPSPEAGPPEAGPPEARSPVEAPKDELARAVAQAVALPALTEACLAVTDLSNEALHAARDLVVASRALRDLADAPEAYLAHWAELEDSVDVGLRQTAAFAFGARHLDHPDALARIRAEKPYATSAGADAWAALAPAVSREQADGGSALGVALKREVVTTLLIPMMHLGQLLTEALPHELPGLEPVAVDVPRTLTEAFEGLGYDYEHVPLYATRERDFLQRRDRILVTPAGPETFPGPPAAEPGVVVRVEQPVIRSAPRGHTVRGWLLVVETA